MIWSDWKKYNIHDYRLIAFRFITSCNVWQIWADFAEFTGQNRKIEVPKFVWWRHDAIVVAYTLTSSNKIQIFAKQLKHFSTKSKLKRVEINMVPLRNTSMTSLPVERFPPKCQTFNGPRNELTIMVAVMNDSFTETNFFRLHKNTITLLLLITIWVASPTMLL